MKFGLYMVAGLSLTLAACATAPPAVTPAPVAKAAAPVEEQVRPPERQIPRDSLYPLLLAEFALRRRDYQLALEQYMTQSALLRDPQVSAHTTHLAQFLQREEEALRAVQLWVELEPDNVEANGTLATLLARQGRTPEALPHLAVVARAGKQANFTALLNGFSRLSPQQQVTLSGDLDALALEFPGDVQLLIAQALVRQQQGKQEQALQKLERVLQLDPTQMQAVALEANLLYELGREQPYTRLEQTLEDDPDNSRLRLQYARMLTRTDMDAARRQFEILSANSPRDGDLLFSLALINRETGDNLTAMAYLRQMLELQQRVDEGHYYMGRIYEDEGNRKEAISHYLQVEDGRDFLSANRRVGALLIAEKKFDEAHAVFNQQRHQHPHRVEQLYAVEVDLLSEANRGDLGMRVLNLAMEQLPQSTPLQYTRSMLGEQQDNLALMESDLRAIIEREPDNATALNALGYSLANRTDRFEEAHALIAQALALSPSEPAILDSMGWVSYRLGDFEAALDYLAQAYAAFPDPEVAAHLGEVLWVTGRREDAIRIWQSALDKDAEHVVLRETIERLGVDLPGFDQ